MRTIRLLSGALFLMGESMAADAGAAELKVVSAEAMKPALQELAPKFEAASKHKLVIAYAPDAAGEKQVASDDTVDIAILPKGSIDKLINSARILTFPKELAAGRTRCRLCRGRVPSHRGTSAAKALMDFLASPEAKKVYEAKGLKTG